MELILDLAKKIADNMCEESILHYLEAAKALMFQDVFFVQEVTQTLKNSISNWTKQKCIQYPQKPIIEKLDLQDKRKWYVEELMYKSQNTKTSGSTTGIPFEYLRFAPAFEKIEWDYHYNLVLDEFSIPHGPHILYMFSHSYKKEAGKHVFCNNGPSELNIVNHGNRRSPIIHYANFDAYQNNRDNFFRSLFDYLEKNRIDVFYTSGPEINSLCSYIRKMNIKGKLGFLLSNTNERFLPEDANFLLSNNYFDRICDHMKCWDGGASFFTCKYNTYHLNDEVCWVESVDDKLISTDYFNICSPFVNYWNGDYCRISNEYKRCECGRLYRDFQFLENRPFSLKGVCISEIKDKLKEMSIQGIRQVRCSPQFLEVVSKSELTEDQKQQITATSNKFKFRFTVES
jgi:hypothetical protein